MNNEHSFTYKLGTVILWLGLGLSCLLLVPVCLLLYLISALFGAADGYSTRLKGTRA